MSFKDDLDWIFKKRFLFKSHKYLTSEFDKRDEISWLTDKYYMRWKYNKGNSYFERIKIIWKREKDKRFLNGKST